MSFSQLPLRKWSQKERNNTPRRSTHLPKVPTHTPKLLLLLTTHLSHAPKSPKKNIRVADLVRVTAPFFNNPSFFVTFFLCDHESNAMDVFCSDGKKTKLWLNQTRLENHENNLFPAKFRDWRPWENSTKNRPLSYYAKLLFSFVLHKRRERFSYMVRYFLKILFAQ